MCYNSISKIPAAFSFEVIYMDKRTLRRLPLDVDDVINLYNSGVRLEDIAIKNDCSVHAIQNCLKRNGVYGGRDWVSYLKRRTGITPDELLALYNSGLWKNEIAAKIGISEGVVGKYLARLGIPLAESRSDAMRARLERVGADGRAKLSESAHNAVRGMKRSESDLIKRAISNERSGKFDSIAERDLFFILRELGAEAIPQKALWKYSIDLAIGNVAVEVTGRGRKPENIPALRERIKYILNSGFVMVWVWANTVHPIESGAAEYIIALCQQASSDPSLIGQYRVIRRDGKLMASGCSDDDDFTGIFSMVSGTYSRT